MIGGFQLSNKDRSTILSARGTVQGAGVWDGDKRARGKTR